MANNLYSKNNKTRIYNKIGIIRIFNRIFNCNKIHNCNSNCNKIHKIYKKCKTNLVNEFLFSITSKRNSNSKTLLLFICMFCWFPILANSATVQKSSIEPLNRLIIEFDKLPPVFESSISADKKTITINLGNTNFSVDHEVLAGEGIIQKVEFSKKEQQTILTISLTAQRGYVTATLPFTQSLLVEVFDWNKLNQAEEEYRTGLLGLTDDCDLAKPHFIAAINGDIGDAGTFLGFCQLSEGKINSALRSFKFAEIKKSTFVDNLAALAQIYNIKKDNANYEKYVKLFKEKTGRNSCPTITIPSITEENDVYLDANKYIDSIVKSFAEIAVADTTSSSDTAEVADTAALNNKFKNVLDTAKKDQSIWEAEDGLLFKYAVGIGLALVLGIIYLYLKWRNKQILDMQEKEKFAKEEASKAEQNIKSEAKSNNKSDGKVDSKADKDNKDKASNKANFGEIVNEKMKETSNKTDENPQKEKTTNSNKPEATSTATPKSEAKNKLNADVKKNANDILNYINNLKDEEVIKSDSVLKSEAELANKASLVTNKLKPKNATQASQSPIVDLNITSKIQQKKSATIQLAEHLASEQKKIKAEKISKLSNTLDMAPEKLAEISQKLGIEKSSLETKQNLENLEKNEDQLQKLSEKFGVKK